MCYNRGTTLLDEEYLAFRDPGGDMRCHFTPYALPLYFSGAASAALCVYAWRRRGTAPCARPLALLALASAWYALGYSFEILAADLPVKILWAKLEYLGIASIPPLVLAFALRYAGYREPLSQRGFALLAAIPAATVLLAFSNDVHGLIWTQTTMEAVGSALLLVVHRGPAFWLFSAYSYGLFLVSAALFANAALHGLGLYRIQGSLLLAGLVLPILTNLGYALGLTPVPNMNPTPVTFALWVVFLGLAIFRFHLLELTPVARQVLVERMRDGVLAVDLYGHVVDANPALARVVRQEPAQMLGRPVGDVLAGQPELAALLHQEEGTETEISIGQGAGRRDYAVSISPMASDPGAPAGRLLVLRDITDLKRLEAQFLQAQKMETIGQLAGGVAHDFNNLLTAITGYASLARDSLAPSAPARADIENILTNTERGTRLTRQLLAFSRRQTMSLRTLDLNELVHDVESMLPRSIGEDIEQAILTASDLGAIRGDPNQIQQVLVNLVLNAADAMPEGGTLTIMTTNATVRQGSAEHQGGITPGEYVVLAVGDTGVGMTKGVKAHLFEPFFTTKEVGKGTGLGLATVLGIVKQHEGSVRVRSAPGEGSTFTIYLPRADEGMEALPPLDEIGLLPEGSETVLLVEDETTVRSFAASVLRELGYTVLEATGGREALSLAERQPPPAIDLLVTVVALPDMRGQDLAAALRRLHPPLKVVFLVGDASTDDGQWGTPEGGAASLPKPFSLLALARQVRALLDAGAEQATPR